MLSEEGNHKQKIVSKLNVCCGLCLNYKYRVHNDRRLNWERIRVSSAT